MSLPNFIRRSSWYCNLLFYLKPAVRYAVITKLPEDADGNEYDELITKQPRKTGFGPNGDIYEDVWVIPVAFNIAAPSERLKVPVFALGEVILVNRYGREIAGNGRKPSKWYVECEYFWTRRAALKRAKEVSR